MEQDNYETPVVFRASRTKDAEVTAVFPCEPWDYQGYEMTCYVHVGQHGGCRRAWYNKTRWARPEEYASLKADLEALGYRLKVYRRIQPFMRVIFNKQVDVWRARK